MKELFRKSQSMLASSSHEYIRPLYRTINWDNKLTALLGARGVGKTTLLLQRLKKLDLPPKKALYIDLGDLYFQEFRLIDFIENYIEQGGRYLFIDEVHRYGYSSWAQELKQIYDLHRKRITIIFTGSSAIRILDQKADLSRRVLSYRIPGLSFREYLWLHRGLEFESISYDLLLSEHLSIQGELLANEGFNPLEQIKDYWQRGYYPVFLEEPDGYLNRINTVIRLVLESDIPHVAKSTRPDYQALSRLLYAIATSAPFKPNVSKISERIGLNRITLLKYLELLETSDLTLSLRAEAKGISTLSKPDKIYLNNTNIIYALAGSSPNAGTLRETFFLNQLNYLTYEQHIIPPAISLPKAGDFLYEWRDGKTLFEVGGKNKSSQQIGSGPGRFVVTDTERTGDLNRIPLWLFGFLY